MDPQNWAVFGFFVACNFVFVAPYIDYKRMDRALVFGDAVQWVYLMSWAQRVLPLHPERLLDWPLAYPLFGAAVSTDLPAGLGILGYLLGNQSTPPILLYNRLLFIVPLLNMLASYVLVRGVGSSRLAGAFAAVGFAFCGGMTWRLAGHLNLTIAFLMPLAMLAVLRASASGATRDLAKVVLLIWGQFLLSTTLGFILSIGAVLLACALIFQKDSRVRLRFWLATFAVTAAGIYLISRPLAAGARIHNIHRSLGEVATFSADPLGYLLPSYMQMFNVAPAGVVLRALSLPLPRYRGEGTNHYLGVWMLAALVGASYSILRRRGELVRQQRRWISVAAIGLILSLGPFLWLGDSLTALPMPWLLVYRCVPPLRTMRSVANFAILVELAGTVLLALWLTRLLASRSSDWMRRLLAAAVLLCYVIEFRVIDGPRLSEYASNPARNWLLHNAATAGPIALLPGLTRLRPLLDLAGIEVKAANGFPAIMNHEFLWQAQILEDFPAPQAIHLARAIGLRHVLVTRAARGVEPGVPTVREVFARSGELKVYALDPLPQHLDNPWREAQTWRRALPAESNMPPDRSISLQFQPETSSPSVFKSNSGKILACCRERMCAASFTLLEPLSSGTHNQIWLRLRYDQSWAPPVYLRVFWAGPGSSYDEGHALNFEIVPAPGLQAYLLDFSSENTWTGIDEIQSVRIDPYFVAHPGASFEIAAPRLLATGGVSQSAQQQIAWPLLVGPGRLGANRVRLLERLK